MTVILDSGSKSANVTISPDGLTMGDTSFPFFSDGARGNTIATTGKVWFETRATNFGLSFCGTGLVISANPNYANIGIGFPDGVFMAGGGSVTVNGVFVGNVEHANYVMYAVDFINHKLWIRSSTASFGWNSLSGDPDAGTFSFDISSVDAAGLYPLGLVNTPSQTILFNFGATPPVNTPPSTFSSWDGSVTPAATRHARVNARGSHFSQVARATSMSPAVLGALAATEQRDTCAVEMYSGVGAIMAATEQRDTCHVVPPARYNVGLLNTPKELADDDVIYVLEDNETMYVPADFSSSFVIHSEDTMTALPFSEP